MERETRESNTKSNCKEDGSRANIKKGKTCLYLLSTTVILR
jgi:hypothetical protein